MATDQEIREAGYKYISPQYYLQNPFELQTTQTTQTANPGGIISTNAAMPYMGYPSYEAWLAAQRRGGDGGGGGDDDDTVPTGNFEWSNFPSLINIARKIGTWGVDKFKDWQNTRAANKESDLMDEITAYNKEGLGSIVESNIATYGTGDRPNTGINAPGGERGQSPTGGDVEGTPFAHGGIVSRLGLAPGGPAGGASAGGDYGGNVNPEQEYAGRTFEETYRGDGPTISDDGPTKKLSISPIINTKTTDLGFTFPTGVVGFDALSPLGKIRATLNLKNYVKGEDVDPQIDYTKNIGNFNFEGTTDLDNYHLGATYNQGPFFAGATTNNMGDTNFNVGARWQWGGKDGGLVGIL